MISEKNVFGIKIRENKTVRPPIHVFTHVLQLLQSILLSFVFSVSIIEMSRSLIFPSKMQTAEPGLKRSVEETALRCIAAL